MFVTLLLVTFLISLTVCTIVVWLFRRPVTQILDRIVAPEMSAAWSRYLGFAIYVVGVSGGVRIWDLEKYITGRGSNNDPILLNGDRWVLEVYRTVLSTLQSTAWLLLLFFLVALVAYVLMRGFEVAQASRHRE
jgi:hypothetical protein